MFSYATVICGIYVANLTNVSNLVIFSHPPCSEACLIVLVIPHHNWIYLVSDYVILLVYLDFIACINIYIISSADMSAVQAQ